MRPAGRTKKKLAEASLLSIRVHPGPRGCAASPLLCGEHVLHCRRELGVRGVDLRVAFALLESGHECRRILAVLVLRRDVLERRTNLFLVYVMTVHAAFRFHDVSA